MEVNNSARQNITNLSKKLADLRLISVIIPTINDEKYMINPILIQSPTKKYLAQTNINYKLQ